jgi:hypothetical protein
MDTFYITPSWRKATDDIAVTYKQLVFIASLRNKDNCPVWPFSSTTNVIRSLTKKDGDDIIQALKDGKKIIFN